MKPGVDHRVDVERVARRDPVQFLDIDARFTREALDTRPAERLEGELSDERQGGDAP